ncbi:MAG TPA: DUF1800 domain-containing protein [Tepidisphaeraceae bacterium]|jgi:uncharacterized protein (DUF1800 family)|nr:DUF1800 domain-containing protein [Tepidisphaeraceae bacterium]
MTLSRGVFRIFSAAVLVAGLSLTTYSITRADDDNNAPPPKHAKTLQERIIETQAGLHDQDLRNNRPQTFVGPELSEREKAVQALNRLSFGPTPGEVEAVTERGWKAWATEQLDPEKIDDSECEKVVAQRFPWVKYSMTQMEEDYGYEKGTKKRKQDGPTSIHTQLPELIVTRAALSKRQFKEIMCDFWRNHFCVDQPRLSDEKSRTWTDPDYEENVIRKFAFGNFKDMLFASARHPAMLEYLDNKLSKRNEWNENYAREVMELHTLGADQGYTNQDVQELSKVLTGWGYDDSYRFKFNNQWHQPGPKRWMGVVIPEGYEGGEQALYDLAMSRRCSEFMSEKLCRYLVNDNPPPALVKRVASVWRDTKGNLPKVYAAIIDSKEFMSRDNYRAKFKTPFYFTISSLRATDAKFDDLGDTCARDAKMGQPIYNCPDPTGYRDVAESWMDAGVLTARWQFSWDLVRGDLSGVKVGDALFSRYKNLKPEEVEAKMIEDLIGGDVGDRELTALKEVAQQGDQPRMVSILLGSPSFQQR